MRPEQGEFFKRIGAAGAEKQKQNRAQAEEGVFDKVGRYVPGAKGCDCERCVKAREKGIRT